MPGHLLSGFLELLNDLPASAFLRELAEDGIEEEHHIVEDVILGQHSVVVLLEEVLRQAKLERILVVSTQEEHSAHYHPH